MDNETIENKNTILLLSVSQLKGKKFVIGNYQRGYKWGKKEILELLNDIHEYDGNSGLYCLQPVILKPVSGSVMETIEIDSNNYSIFTENEVIDGQQRTTSLFLLLSYLQYLHAIDINLNYGIEFNTRSRSGKFLTEDLKLLFDLDLSSITVEDLEHKNYADIEKVNVLWVDFIANHKQYDNVDVYHFFTVTCYLRKWISLFLEEDELLKQFVDKLLHQVKVIWYSLDQAIENTKVIDVFLNNNKGKIRLTTSELIKALFILNIKSTEIKALAELHINRFALEWDSIEKKLQDDSFWYFIQPNETLYTNGTRIDYLFDLHLEKKAQDEQFAYRYYEAAYNENEKSFDTEWNKIIELFNKLIDWYNDSELYHYVGFLTNAGINNLQAIIKEVKGKNKLEIRKKLIELIVTHFNKTAKDKDENGNENGELYKVYDLDRLHYKKSYYETKKILLLHNVMYYVHTMSNHKFPFELYIKENWSIEHIVPQNPKDITDFDLYKEWFIEQAQYQIDDDDKERHSVIEKLKSKRSFLERDADEILCTELSILIDSFEDRTHLINNLLLLDRNTNSALQNEGFAKKRETILKYDRNGQTDKSEAVFIPVETLNAFNKTFSSKIEFRHWTLLDGENYKQAIWERLKDFLPQTIES